MDIVYIRDLKIETVIGIYDWERETLQTLRFDLEMDWDIRQAAQSDDISNTLDYGAVANVLVEFVANSRYLLIERLAEEVAQLLLKTFAIPKLKLTLTKPVKLHGQNYAQIVIERSNG